MGHDKTRSHIFKAAFEDVISWANSGGTQVCRTINSCHTLVHSKDTLQLMLLFEIQIFKI